MNRRTKTLLMVFIGGVLLVGTAPAWAVERRLEQLPGDVFDILFLWTEPLKEVAKQSRRFDPVSGLWLGLVEGTRKSLERSARFFLFQDRGTAPSPREPGEILRYSF